MCLRRSLHIFAIATSNRLARAKFQDSERDFSKPSNVFERNEIRRAHENNELYASRRLSLFVSASDRKLFISVMEK